MIHFLTEQNAYLTWNFTAYMFYRSLSDWAGYGLLVTGRYAAELIGGRGLFDRSSIASDLM